MIWKYIFLLIAIRLGNIYSFRIQDSFVVLQMSTWVCSNSCSSAFGSFQQQSKLKPASDDSRDGASFLLPWRADKKDQYMCIRTVRGQWCNFSDSDFQVQTVQLLIRGRAMCGLSSHFLYSLKWNPGSKYASLVTFIGPRLLIVIFFFSYMLVSPTITILIPLYASFI